MKDNRVLVKFTLLFISSLGALSGAIIAPALPRIRLIFQENPDAELLSRLLVTFPALLITLASPSIGRLMDRYGRKKFLLFALLIYALGGTSGLYLNDLYSLLAGRALLGAGIAGVITAVITLAGDYYSGKERNDFLGQQSAFMGMGGVVFVGLGGLLADIHWRAPFYAYGLSLIFAIPAFLILKEPKITPNPTGKNDPRGGIRVGLLFVILFSAFFSMAMFFLIPVQIPFLVQELGREKSVYSGLALMCATSSAALSALNYRRLRSHLSFEMIICIAHVVMGLGFFIAGTSSSYGALLPGLVLSGIGAGMLMPNMSSWIISLAPPEVRGRLVGRLSAMTFLGQFASPLFAEPLRLLSSTKGIFLYSSAFLSLSAIWTAFLALRNRKRANAASLNAREIRPPEG